MFHHSQNKQHPRHRFVLTIMNQCFNFSFISMSFTSSYASQQIFYSLCVTFFILLSFFKLSTAFDTCFVLQSIGRFFYLVIFLAVQCFHRLSQSQLHSNSIAPLYVVPFSRCTFPFAQIHNILLCTLFQLFLIFSALY